MRTLALRMDRGRPVSGVDRKPGLGPLHWSEGCSGAVKLKYADCLTPGGEIGRTYMRTLAAPWPNV